MAKKYLTPSELAERWGLSETTLYDRRVAGLPPAWEHVGPKDSKKPRVLYDLAAVLKEEQHRNLDKPGAKDRMLKIAEVAALANVRPLTIRRWARDGKFPPAIRLTDSCLRWSEEAVLKWRAERAAA